MGSIIAEVIDSIGVLTSRIGYTGDPDYVRKRLRECEISNAKLLAENNFLKEENIKLLGKLNRHDRQEVKFSKSKFTRDIETSIDIDLNKDNLDDNTIKDIHSKNKRNYSNTDFFPPLPQRATRINMPENENYKGNKFNRDETNHDPGVREPVADDSDDLKRIELQNRSRFFTKEMEKFAAEKD